MPQTLEDIVKTHIAQHGPMDVGQYMAMALGHPQHGYYMKQDPFGVGGDFTTAPEISQMFGEIIGAWVVHQWMQLGSPDKFALLECGPGRGTLMADILRSCKNVSGFVEAAQIHLLDISPTLKTIQAETLKAHAPTWIDTIETVPTDIPIIVIANEFLDALPFRQLLYTSDGWQERVICEEEGGLRFAIRSAGMLASYVPSSLTPKARDIFEIAPARESVFQDISARIENQKGAALFIDYGHTKSGFGDTFQALYKHNYVDVFAHIGDADLTSHVDFAALTKLCPNAKLHTQGDFLAAFGIEIRAKALLSQKLDIDQDLQRLIGHDQMGELFKVMEISA